MSQRAAALADRLEKGAKALAELASSTTEAEWNTPLPGDGRTVGVVVHHVASVYPIEIQLAQVLASGKPITDVTWAGIHKMNADHHRNHAETSKADTLALLERNSAAAAAAVRAMTDADLDNAAKVSLNSDAPLTAQFMLEDHAVRHSYHHIARIRAALGR